MSGRPLTRAFVFLSVVVTQTVLTSCGSKDKEIVVNDPSHRTPPAADVAELEIRTEGVDRFSTCPPPGALGQHWIPPPFPWTPPAPAPGPALSSADAGPGVEHAPD